jgi:hypothetical protein
MAVAIRETRKRLASRVVHTADRIHLLFTTPAAAEAEAGAGGVVGGAITALTTAGRAKRMWSDARTTGLVRRAAVGGVTIALAAVLATKKRRR